MTFQKHTAFPIVLRAWEGMVRNGTVWVRPGTELPEYEYMNGAVINMKFQNNTAFSLDSGVWEGVVRNGTAWYGAAGL